jgi:aspartate kinase
MGASILHEGTVFPIHQLNIPINLRNTSEPENPGTTIREVCSDTTQTVTGIAGKKDICAFNIFKDHMSNDVGFMAKTLAIFKDYEVSIEDVPSGNHSFSVVVPYSQVEKCQYELVTELKKELDAEVTFEKDLALVAVVGRNMAKRAGICGKIFAALDEERVNVRLLAPGPQELNIIIGVSFSDFEKTIALLYDALIK